MLVKDRIAEIGNLQRVSVPWEVMRTGIYPRIVGEELSLTSDDGSDIVTLEEARVAIRWIANQLGLIVLKQQVEETDVETNI